LLQAIGDDGQFENGPPGEGHKTRRCPMARTIPGWKSVEFRFDGEGRLFLRGNEKDLKPLLWKGKVLRIGTDEFMVQSLRNPFDGIMPDYDCRCTGFIIPSDMKAGVAPEILGRRRHIDKPKT